MAENVVKIRPALTALKIGESITFPISKLKSVRTQASELGAIYNRQAVQDPNQQGEHEYHRKTY